MTRTRILLADDHDLVRFGIRNALRDLPNLEIVGEVGDGPGLTAALAALQPDLLIIDVAMPEFEPITAMRWVRRQYPQLRILVVSAHDDDVYVQGLLREGVNGYHLKDQPLEDLRLAVLQVLAGRRWISGLIVDKLVRAEGNPPPAAPRPSGSAEPTAGQAPLPRLSARQIEILRRLAEGLDNRTIAEQMGLSIKTVETHLTRLYRQLNVQSRLEAANYAHEHRALLAGGVVEPERAVSPEAADWLPPSTVLVVDDNARYRRQMQRLIGRLHPQAAIYEAADTAEALGVARRVAPHLIFVDVVLGEENGIRCAQRLKAQQPQARVILMSAYPDREFHRLGLAAGASAFIDKQDLNAGALYQILQDAND